MAVVWDTGTVVSGSGSARRVGNELKVILGVVPDYLSASSPAPLYYRNLGLVGAKVGSAHYRPTILQWAESVLDPLPKDADAVYWRLVNGVSGTLYQGVEIMGTPAMECMVRRTTVQSIPNNAYTPLSFDAEVRDPFGMHSPATNPTRVTVPAPGLYSCVATVGWTVAAAGRLSIGIRRNGGDNIGSDQAYVPAGAADLDQQAVAMFQLDEGDYLEVVVHQNTGSAKDVYSYGSLYPSLSVVRVE